MSKTSVSPSGTGAWSRKPGAAAPTASTIRSTERGAGAHPRRSRSVCRVGANAIIAQNFATSVTRGNVNPPASPSARDIGRSRRARRSPTALPTGCWTATLPNLVPSSPASLPMISCRVPLAVYRCPVGHRAAWCAKNSVMMEAPSRSMPVHKAASTSVAVDRDGLSANSINWATSRWISARTSGIFGIGLSRRGFVV